MSSLFSHSYPLKRFRMDADGVAGYWLGNRLQKNPALFADLIRSDNMKYPGLMEAFKEDVDERVREQEQNTTAVHLKDIMEALGVGIERAMDILKIPKNERAIYVGML